MLAEIKVGNFEVCGRSKNKFPFIQDFCFTFIFLQSFVGLQGYLKRLKG